MTRLILWTVFTMTTGICVSAYAAPGEVKAPGPAPGASRQLVEQKAAFLRRVFSDSAAVRRIEISGNVEAKKYLASAQKNYRDALRAIKNKDMVAADKQLNEATLLVGKARQLVPDSLGHNAKPRMRYARLLESVESLRVSYQRHLQRAIPQPGVAAADDALLVTVTQLVAAAKRFAKAEQVTRANHSLAEAERTLVSGLGRVLGSNTIEYAQRFDTLAEEYAYELERNRSYAGLIPLAIDGFKPSKEANHEARHLMDVNRGLRDQAQRHAAAKDYRSALATLRDGTAQLQSALTTAGLRVPRDQ